MILMGHIQYIYSAHYIDASHAERCLRKITRLSLSSRLLMSVITSPPRELPRGGRNLHVHLSMRATCRHCHGSGLAKVGDLQRATQICCKVRELSAGHRSHPSKTVPACFARTIHRMHYRLRHRLANLIIKSKEPPSRLAFLQENHRGCTTSRDSITPSRGKTSRTRPAGPSYGYLRISSGYVHSFKLISDLTATFDIY